MTSCLRGIESERVRGGLGTRCLGAAGLPLGARRRWAVRDSTTTDPGTGADGTRVLAVDVAVPPPDRLSEPGSPEGSSVTRDVSCLTRSPAARFANPEDELAAEDLGRLDECLRTGLRMGDLERGSDLTRAVGRDPRRSRPESRSSRRPRTSPPVIGTNAGPVSGCRVDARRGSRRSSRSV